MLFAVEGGGFFSSSASGYSKGLALLLLGQRNEEKTMRVSPWNHYHLVEQRVESERLASRKKRAPCACTSFTCFGCKSGGSDGFSKSKVGTIQKCESSPPSSDSSDRDKVRNSDSADESDVKVFLKSSLKKSSSVNCSVPVGNGDDKRSSAEEAQSDISYTDRRKIHWTDAHGKELAEIREFEPSEIGASDNEFEHDVARRCQCVIQ